MGTRTTDLAEGEFYHVYNRGTDKRPVFQSDDDYNRFLGLLFLSNAHTEVNYRDILRSHDPVFSYEKDAALVAVGAYCLMPNHFHILLTPLVEDGVSIFMRKLGTSYSMYFNRKYERTGTLFEGRFKSKHAHSDEYLKYLYAYIHLNPTKLMPEITSKTAENTITFLKNYQYSSFVDYLGSDRKEGSIIDPKPFPDYFVGAAQQLDELRFWLTLPE